MEAGDQEEAINYLKLIIHRWPKHVNAYGILASIYLKQADWQKAGETYIHLTQLQPNRVPAWVNLAFIFDKLNIHEEAIKCCKKALSLKPDAKKALNILAFSLLKADQKEQAREVLDQYVSLFPGSVVTEYMLAAISGDNQPSQSPTNFIINTFDDYAANFEHSLVKVLKYNIPEKLDVALRKQLSDQSTQFDIIDLGCGTGLMGEKLKDISSYLTGVDLSEKMLEQAEKKQIYDEILKKDILEAITQIDKSYDLVVSTDVFIYIGDLSEIFEKINIIMTKNGLFGFSIELAEDNTDYKLQHTGRYAQSLRYIHELIKKNNYQLCMSEKTVVRMEHHQPIDGYIFVLKKE